MWPLTSPDVALNMCMTDFKLHKTTRLNVLTMPAAAQCR